MRRIRSPHGWVSVGSDITDLMHSTIRRHMDLPKPDHVLHIETHCVNVRLYARSCAYDFDMAEVHLNRSRWSRLIREYVPLTDVTRFINHARQIYAGEARKGASTNMQFHDPMRNPKKHRWGGCLIGATFHGAHTDQPTLTFYSRTTYMGYLGFLDAAIAHVIARKILEPYGDPLSGIAFQWYLSTQQVHCFKTLPYLYSKPDLAKQLLKYARTPNRSMPPTWRSMVRWHESILKAWKEHGLDMLDHEKYGPFKRIKRRWMEIEKHSDKPSPPSVKVADLDFDKAQ